MPLSFLTSAGSATDLTTYTFSDQTFGTASSDRYIVLTINSRDAGENNPQVSSVTIGGVSASIVVQDVNQATNANISAIAIAAVPTGETGDVVITFNTEVLRCVIALYKVTELYQTTPSDTDSSTASSPSVSLDIPAKGFSIATACTASDSGTFSWTGLTENHDSIVEFLTASSASSEFISQQSGLTITATPNTSSNQVGVFASWRFIPRTPVVSRSGVSSRSVISSRTTITSRNSIT